MSATRLRSSRLFFAALWVAGSLAACSAEAGAAPSSPETTQVASPASPAAGPDAWLVVGRRGEPGLDVILASTGERLVTLPNGVPGETWGDVVTAAGAHGSTRVDELAVQPDLPIWRSRSVEGAWRLPTLGYDPLPVGMSADGSVVVLVETDPDRTTGRTRFAVFANDDPVRVIELRGSLEFDALSPDGSILYVIEHLPAPPDGRYQVRAIDLPTGQMRDTVITDKRNIDTAMGGWPITQEAHTNGVMFTLYRGAGHPFIHALQTKEAWAVCIGLPPIGHEDAEAALDWGIGQSADGRRVFAVNATLGLAVAIDPTELSIREATAFEAPRASARIELAKFGHVEPGPSGRRVVVSPDGASIFAAGAGGVVRLETTRLTVSNRYLEGTSVDGLALTLDGSTLFALAGDGRIVRLDTSTGDVVGTVAGDGYDRMVGIVPW